MRDVIWFGLIRAPHLTRTIIPISLKFGSGIWVKTKVLYDLFGPIEPSLLRKELSELTNILFLECHRAKACEKALPRVKFCELVRINPRFYNITRSKINNWANRLGLNLMMFKDFMNYNYARNIDVRLESHCHPGNPTCLRSLPKQKGSQKEFFKFRKWYYSRNEILSAKVEKRPLLINPLQALILFIAYNYIVVYRTAHTIVPASLYGAIKHITGKLDEEEVKSVFDRLCELELFRRIGKTYTLCPAIKKLKIPWNWKNLKSLFVLQNSYSKMLGKLELLSAK